MANSPSQHQNDPALYKVPPQSLEAEDAIMDVVESHKKSCAREWGAVIISRFKGRSIVYNHIHQIEVDSGKVSFDMVCFIYIIYDDTYCHFHIY